MRGRKSGKEGGKRWLRSGEGEFEREVGKSGVEGKRKV